MSHGHGGVRKTLSKEWLVQAQLGANQGAHEPCVALTQAAPQRNGSSVQYVLEVQETMDAAIRLKPAWFEFLNQAVLTAQKGLKLPHPPVFVFLFLDFHLAPGAADAVAAAFRKMSHPRLLCLFGEGQ